MGLNWPAPGPNHVSEYQASGHILPITSSAIIKLNYVASSITMGSTAGSVTFYDSAHEGQAVTMAAGSTLKAKFLTFSSVEDCFVTLTNIPSASYVSPTYGSLTR